jgi:lipopolysaccharide export system permease protein
VKIINRYVLKEHVGPFVFALSALTSLLLLQYIARKFGDLVGRGLSWQVIGEFFLLSIPFTVAMTLPMAVLVAVLYAFSRLAAENEVTALKAGGISARSLMKPALFAATLLAMFMLWFNDQLLPKANHELAALQMAIFRTKPTFALKPQILNIVKEGQLYIRAGDIAADRTGRMTDVTIYDVGDPTKRRTIYADSGTLSFAGNRRDLMMHLYHGMMMSSPTDKPGQVDRIYYTQDVLRIRDVANSFVAVDADTAMKGDREMSVCEMQKEYERTAIRVNNARFDSTMTAWRLMEDAGHHSPEPKRPPVQKLGGIGELYCTFVHNYLAKIPSVFKPAVAHAAEAPLPLQAQDTTKKAATKVPAVPPQKPNSVFVLVGGQYVKVPIDKIPAGASFPQPSSATRPVPTPPAAAPPKPAPAPLSTNAPKMTGSQLAKPAAKDSADVAGAAGIMAGHQIELNDARMRIDQARHEQNRYAVEIQKKFSLAAACIVLVLVGAPIALRFPNGGVGLVFGVSFFIFAIYYVGLIGGEALSDRSIIPPFWAMWADNIIFTIIGLLLMLRMGNEGVTSRGGGIAEAFDKVKSWFHRPEMGQAL